MDQDEIERKLADLTARSERQQRRFHARQPRAIGNVLSALVLKKRYACVESNEQLARVWSELVGPDLSSRSRAIGVKRGQFEIMVAHSALAQQLSFTRLKLLAGLRAALPEIKIDDLRFRVGTIKTD